MQNAESIKWGLQNVDCGMQIFCSEFRTHHSELQKGGVAREEPTPFGVGFYLFHKTFSHKRPPDPIMIDIRTEDEKVNEGSLEDELLKSS